MSGTKSYTSHARKGALSEMLELARGSEDQHRKVKSNTFKQLEECRRAERLYAEVMGQPLEGKDVLEIGTGQILAASRFFAVKNRVTATDLDVVALGWNVPAYVAMLRQNGLKRVIKTIGRKTLQIDSRYVRELEHQIGARPRPRFQQMDATKMPFPDGSFDFIFSFNVFEHLPEPATVLAECKRVLRPGGCVFTHLHLYSCDSGCHDLRINRGEHDNVPYWPHLRPQHEHEVQAAAYLNKITLKDWIAIFERALGPCRTEFVKDDNLRPELTRLREGGELKDYSDDELLVHNIITLWKKPTS